MVFWPNRWSLFNCGKRCCSASRCLMLSSRLPLKNRIGDPDPSRRSWLGVCRVDHEHDISHVFEEGGGGERPADRDHVVESDRIRAIGLIDVDRSLPTDFLKSRNAELYREPAR